MPRVYATPQQYADWLHPESDPGTEAPPAGAERALRAASGRVEDMLLAANYPTDAEGMPTVAAHIEALMEATCAQADYQKGIGDPNSTNAPHVWSSVKVGSAAMSRGTKAGGGTATPSTYSDEAAGILQRAGLIPEGPWAY
jgi:hypothetical protein